VPVALAAGAPATSLIDPVTREVIDPMTTGCDAPIPAAGLPRIVAMHQTLAVTPDSARRWRVLAIVVAAQFMFGVDSFIVNVALPTISVDLNASSSQLEAVIAIYLIGYATLIVTGGRLGDIYGTKTVFLAGVTGFTLTSLWCGLAQSGTELILARLAQGTTAALMVPQVLATLHVLFPDAARAKAFAIYGIVLGLAGAAGFALGGALVTLDLGGYGWRAIFFVNVPVGLVIFTAAALVVPQAPRRPGTRLDLPGAAILFTGLLCVIGPLLFGRDVDWAGWIWPIMACGVAIVLIFVRYERGLAARGGMPLIDLALLADPAFMRGLGAVFCFFFANQSFYLVVTLYMQMVLKVPPLPAGLVFLPLALAFVIAARHSGGACATPRDFGLDRGLPAADRRPRSGGADGRHGRGADAVPAGAGADRGRLRPGSGDGAIVRRGAVDGPGVERRLRVRSVRHRNPDLLGRRHRRDRLGLLLAGGGGVRPLRIPGGADLDRRLGCRQHRPAALDAASRVGPIVGDVSSPAAALGFWRRVSGDRAANRCRARRSLPAFGA